VSTKPPHALAGPLSIAAAIGIASLVFLRPEQLNAPAWVAYAAAAAFFLAGVAMLALRAGASRRTTGWIVVALLACLLTPTFWIAVTDPVIGCSLDVLGWWIAGTGWACRGGFLVITAFGVLMLVLAVRQALRPPPRP
jgi:hypothetical protein